MAAMWLITLSDFVQMMKDQAQQLEHRYPYFAVLLYSPMNGLEGQVHQYITSHWSMLNALTGDNCLMMALADSPSAKVEDFTPGDVYQIARLLGVDVASLPCVVFFTEPSRTADTLVLSLSQFFATADDANDEHLTKWFRTIQSIIDECVTQGSGDRLSCLRTGIDERFPSDADWMASVKQLGKVAVPSMTTAATVLQALATIVPIVARMTGGG
jgi:hypothetical protein